MSVKRQATTELNHDNWDQEDPTEHEDMGSFKTAAKDVLEKRVIRTAKRRSQVSGAGSDAKKSIFSGFGGFNKSQPSSFDFLSKLTNGSTATNVSLSSETAVPSSLFNNKPLTSSPASGAFNTSVTSSPAPAATAGGSAATSIFGTSNNITPSPTLLSSSKADSSVTDSPFKIQSTAIPSATNKDTPFKMSPQSSSVFGALTKSNNKSTFAITSGNSSPFKMPPSSSTTATSQNTFGTATKTTTIINSSEKKTEATDEEKKLKFYAKLKALNESVSDWIKKHVEETPLCILTPIFKDYENYLKEIQGESDDSKSEDNLTKKNGDEEKNKSVPSFNNTTSSTSENKASASPFRSSDANKPNALFGAQNNGSSQNQAPFSFGINNQSKPTSLTATSAASTGFSFGINTSTSANAATTATPFAGSSTTAPTNGSAPFSFGIGKPFAFSSNIQKPADTKEEEKDEEDTPPKVEYTPIVEENSVYEKKCKIFVKKDEVFADKGIGTLYIKKIEESGKHQLLVRANTNLGNVLLNLVLTSSIPIKRLGKNNVMMVCIPTPDAKPPPVATLIRVKTGEEADELLETLEKYKS